MWHHVGFFFFFLKKQRKLVLTNIVTQCVHINPTIKVPAIPNAKPPCLKAKGIAKIPDPKLLFSK